MFWGCMEILPIHCGAGSVKVMREKMKTNLNESSRFQLIRTEKTTEKRLLTSSNRATIVCTNEEQHKLAAQNNFYARFQCKSGLHTVM